jgi:hypothetical protein
MIQKRSDAVNLIALYHFFCGALSLLAMCALFSLPFIVGIASINTSDGATATAITGVVGLIVGGVFLLLAAANLVCGWGLWQRREWARLGAIGLSVFRLINIPLGTFIGLLIIWYLLQDHIKAEFTA